MTTLRKDDRSRADDVRRLHLAGLTVREIARNLDLSTQAVYWHLNRLGLRSPNKVAS